VIIVRRKQGVSTSLRTLDDTGIGSGVPSPKCNRRSRIQESFSRDAKRVLPIFQWLSSACPGGKNGRKAKCGQGETLANFILARGLVVMSDLEHIKNIDCSTDPKTNH
jgi:hypothetical protein